MGLFKDREHTKRFGRGWWGFGEVLDAREEYKILLNIYLFVFVLTKLHKKILAEIIAQKSLKFYLLSNSCLDINIKLSFLFLIF